MPARCRVCTHPDAESIDQAILNGRSLKKLALDFGFSYTDGRTGDKVGDHKTLIRHRDKCMVEDVALAIQAKKVDHGVAITKRLDEMDKVVDLVITDAKAGRVVMVGDAPMLEDDGTERRERGTSELRVLLTAVSQARGNAELRAKLMGAIESDDSDEVEKIRRAQEDPEIRKALAELDERLANQ